MSACLKRAWQAKDGRRCVSRDSREFLVVSYNVLAECTFNDLTYPFCPAGHRGTYERHPKLMVELEHHKNADVICLQEVETKYFHELLKPSLKDLGFDGRHFSKVLGNEEGAAIFYRLSSVELLNHQEIVFKDLLEQAAQSDLDIPRQEEAIARCNHGNVGMIFTLRHISSRKEVCVMNVHLLWKTKEYLDVNTLQAALAVRKLTEAAGTQRGMVLCGDFNHTTEQPGYDVIATGRVSRKNRGMLQKFAIGDSCLIDLAPSWFQHSQEDRLCSSYLEVLGEEPLFTVYTDPIATAWLAMQETSKATASTVGTLHSLTHESDRLAAGAFPERCVQPAHEKGSRAGGFRERPSDRRSLDYIWFGLRDLCCVRVLNVVGESLIEPFWACPNEEFPSDHMLIGAVFTWR